MDSQWVSANEDEHLACIQSLADDSAQRAAWRSQARATLQASALMDEVGFTNCFEDAIAAAWVRRTQQNHPPKSTVQDAALVAGFATVTVHYDPSAVTREPDEPPYLALTRLLEQRLVNLEAAPPLGSQILGSIPANSTPATTYAVLLPPSTLQSAVGGMLTLAVKGAAADTFYVNSREATTARPQLVLATG